MIRSVRGVSEERDASKFASALTTAATGSVREEVVEPTLSVSTMNVESPLIPAAAVARRLGWKTATLSNKRCRHEDPPGAVHISTTLVVYPLKNVEQFRLRLLAGADARREAARERMAVARAARRPRPRS